MTTSTRSLDALLAEARWLERLARELVSDREEARELVQEVWVAAAARAPEHIDRPRAWLATVLRNALGMRGRGASAREERERRRARAAADSAASAHEVVARAEAQRLLVECVLALDEPWRSTVLWHHFDGESCESIARRLGVSASTVRNRLTDARARLRGRLEQKRTDWLPALIPLATPPGVASAAVLAPAGGWVILSTSLKLAAAAAAVALGVWWIGFELESGSTEAPERVAAAPAPEVEREAVDPPVDAHAERSAVSVESSTPEATSIATIASAGPGEFLVRVVEDDRPYTGGGVARLGEGLLANFSSKLDLALAADGTARFTGVPAKRGAHAIGHVIEVELANGDLVHSPALRMPEGEGREHVFRVGSARVFGTVWDEYGGPASGVEVVLMTVTAPPNTIDGSRVGVTDVRGHYAIERVPAGPCHARVARTQQRGSGQMVREENPRFELARGEARQLDFGTPNSWPAWTGRVLTRVGSPPPDIVWVRVPSPMRIPDSWALQRCSADGSFEVHVPPGTHAVEVLRGVDWGVVHRFADVVVGASSFTRDLELPGTRLSGTVFAADGARLGTNVVELSISVRIEGHDYPAAFQTWRVARDGSFAIEALPPGTYVLTTHPLELAPASAALRITIAQGDVEVRADVRLKPR